MYKCTECQGGLFWRKLTFHSLFRSILKLLLYFRYLLNRPRRTIKMYRDESKIITFFFSTGIITNTGTCILPQNEAEPLWITSIVTVSLNNSVPSSNESMYPYLIKFRWLFFEHLHHSSFHFLVTDMKFINSSAPWKRVDEANIMPVTRKWKLQGWRGSKNNEQNFMRQGYMLSFENGTLLVREMVTMLRSRDVILSGPASFWCMIHVPVLVIIPVQKKKAVIFDYSSYQK